MIVKKKRTYHGPHCANRETELAAPTAVNRFSQKNIFRIPFF
jgi:hypothetical protein